MSDDNTSLPATRREVEGTGVSLQPAGGKSNQVTPTDMGQVLQFAQMMAKSGGAVPEKFRGNPGMCLAVTMDALHTGFNPFALVRHAYEVSGTMAYEAKVLHAIVDAHAPLQKPLKIEFLGEISGTHDIENKYGKKSHPAGTRQCRVIGFLNGDDDPREYTTPELGDIKIKNSPLWDNDPDQQLAYYAVRAWARRWTPAALMGFLGVDEVQDNPDLHQLSTDRPALEDRLKAAKQDAEANGNAQDAEFEELEEGDTDDVALEVLHETAGSDADGDSDGNDTSENEPESREENGSEDDPPPPEEEKPAETKEPETKSAPPSEKEPVTDQEKAQAKYNQLRRMITNAETVMEVTAILTEYPREIEHFPEAIRNMLTKSTENFANERIKEIESENASAGLS